MVRVVENEQRDKGAAEKNLLRSIEVCEKIGRAADEDRGRALCELGLVKKEFGNLKKAEECLQQALRLYKAAAGPADWFTLNITDELIKVKIERKEFDSISPLLDSILQNYELHFAKDVLNRPGKPHDSAANRVNSIYKSLKSLSNLSPEQETQRLKFYRIMESWFASRDLAPQKE